MKCSTLFSLSILAMFAISGCGEDSSSASESCPKSSVCDGDLLIYCEGDIEKTKICEHGCENDACKYEAVTDLCADKKCLKNQTCNPQTGECLSTDTTTHECPENEHWNETESKCVPNSDDSHACPENEHWDDTESKCVPNSDDSHACPENEHWDDTESKCVPNSDDSHACPENEHWDVTESKCVPNSDDSHACPENEHWDVTESKCVQNEDTHKCSDGENYDISLARCIETCKPGYTYDSKTSKCVYDDPYPDMTVYQKHQKAIQETAMAFYRRGTNLQYDLHRLNHYLAPEDATPQKLDFLVCNSFVFAVYYQTFGIDMPFTTERYNAYGSQFKDQKGNDDIVYFVNGEDIKKEVKTPEARASLAKSLLEKVEIGDALSYYRYDSNTKTGSGHVMLIYDLEYDAKGNRTNAIILHSTSNFEPNKDRTTKLSSSLSWFATINKETNVKEGTIQRTNLKTIINANWENNTEIILYRPITDDKNYRQLTYKSVANKDYPNNWTITAREVAYELTEAAKSRLQYSGIEIIKTVDVFDGSTVAPGDAMKYTIDITNHGLKAYKDLTIVEDIPEFVVPTDLGGGTLSDNSKTITWTIPAMKAGSNHTIQYAVTVKDKTEGKEIVSTGRAANIATGKITNLVAHSLTADEIKKLKTSFDNLKTDYSGAELIQKVYFDALHYEIPLKNLILGALYAKEKATQETKDRLKGKPYYHDNKVDALISSYYGNFYTDIKLEGSHVLSPMLLNHYYSAVHTSYPKEGASRYTQKYFEDIVYNSNPDTRRSDRRPMVYSKTLKSGDILLYANTDDAITNEDGLYAFIYLDGKFQGVNSKTVNGQPVPVNELKVTKGEVPTKYEVLGQKEMIELYGDMPKLFGKDFYVILRPAIVMN